MPSAFNQQMKLSQNLSQVCNNKKQLSRPQVVKHLWKYIKSNKLQDRNDGRMINCDQKMQKVFGTRKMNMMKMNKLLSKSLSSISTGGGKKKTIRKSRRSQK